MVQRWSTRYLDSRVEEGIDDAKFLAEVVANHPTESSSLAAVYVLVSGKGLFRATKRARKGHNYIYFNHSHIESSRFRKGKGPNGGGLQPHHGLQGEWAEQNLAKYGYKYKLAPTITIETGKGLPHTIINNAQESRRLKRIADGKGAWSSTLQEELQYIVDDLSIAGFKKKDIEKVMEQQYRMLNDLEVPFTRIEVN